MRHGLRELIALTFSCFFGLHVAAAGDEPKAEAPTRAGTIARDGFDLHYRVFGSEGPVLVLLAGGPGVQASYLEPVARELAKHFQCILPDQRGTGRSRLPSYDAHTLPFSAYLDDLEALRGELNQEKLILVGHSWGTTLGLAYAGRWPDHVRALVSLASSPLSDDDSLATAENTELRLTTEERDQFASWNKRIADEPEKAVQELFRLTMPSRFFDRHQGLKMRDQMSADFVNVQVLLLTGKPKFRSAQADSLGKLPMVMAPVLLIHGRQDTVPETSALSVHQKLRNSQLKLLHRCGHFPWLEQPEPFWQAVNGFLESLDGRQ